MDIYDLKPRESQLRNTFEAIYDILIYLIITRVAMYVIPILMAWFFGFYYNFHFILLFVYIGLTIKLYLELENSKDIDSNIYYALITISIIMILGVIEFIATIGGFTTLYNIAVWLVPILELGLRLAITYAMEDFASGMNNNHLIEQIHCVKMMLSFQFMVTFVTSMFTLGWINTLVTIINFIAYIYFLVELKETYSIFD